MKRCLIVLLCAVLAVTMAGSVLGAGGTAGDPAVTLSYLDEVFTPALEEDYTRAVLGGLGSTYRTAFSQAAEAVATQRQANQKAAASIPQKAAGSMTLKQGDMLTIAPGCKVTLLSGTVAADTSYLIDVTNGRAVTKLTNLAQNILYMLGDSTTGELVVRSATAELTVNGVYRLSPSDSVDYGSLAQALSAMGLFQGTGRGFALESTANRAQGLVMFLRILGLEDEALAYTGSCPFTDVPRSHWASSYVAYAYHQGLTTGTSATTFSPDRAITCQHYATFLLRALNYREETDFTYNSAVGDLVTLGLFSQTETNTLSSGAFYRYKMAYLSYYALFGVDQGTGLLLMDRLVRDGSVSRQSLAAGLCLAVGGRIG